MQYLEWAWRLVPDDRPGVQLVATAILVAFVFVIVLSVVTSLATILRGEPPWRWGGMGRPRRRVRRT